MTTNINVASRQWATRPADQRFTSLEDLKQAVLQRKRESWTATPTTNLLRVVPSPALDGDINVQVYDPTHGEQIRQLEVTNWSFSQLAQYVGAPAAYLRKLPAELASINLQWGLEHSPVRDNVLVLGQSNGSNVLRAITSTSYGRIWDHQVVEAVERVNADGRWQIPASICATTNPKRATTLYASDRDVFLFLVDPKNPVEIGDERLFRGFYTWNSEVGSATFGLTTFLYRHICDNRIIWGASDVREVRIRHTGGAPERFAYEGQQYLQRYAEESTEKLVGAVKRAQTTDVPVNAGKDETVQDWLAARGFTKSQAKSSVDAAEAEQGSSRSIWDIVNGITAYARSIQNTDDRVALETKAGKLLEAVAA
jgi:hypothetical protein